MTRLERLNHAQAKLRSYASMDDAGIDQDDQDEAQGMGECAMNLAATHDDDQMADLTDDLHDGLGNIDPDDDDEKRAYLDTAGKVLRPSKKNPKVRRWIKQAAFKHVGNTLADSAGMAVNGSGASARANDGLQALHHAERRETGLGNDAEREKASALHSMHYHTHHKEFVESSAKKYGLSHNTVAYALAQHARAELAKQRRADGPMKNGKPQPLRNKDITDKDFHKNLGGRAKSAFIKGMIARHGK